MKGPYNAGCSLTEASICSLLGVNKLSTHHWKVMRIVHQVIGQRVNVSRMGLYVLTDLYVQIPRDVHRDVVLGDSPLRCDGHGSFPHINPISDAVHIGDSYHP